MSDLDYPAMLQIALEEARQGRAEGGIPIGAALFNRQGQLLGRGHNRRVQEDDPSAHAETDAFRKAGRRHSYRDTIMVTTLDVLVLQWPGAAVSDRGSGGGRLGQFCWWTGMVTRPWRRRQISMTPRASRSWLSTLRRIRSSGMRISARSNAWLAEVRALDSAQAPHPNPLPEGEGKEARLLYADPVRFAWARSPYHGILGWDTL